MEENLDDLVNKIYTDQTVNLSSKQIGMIISVFRSNVNKLRERGMDKMANHRESMLWSIINELK